jgi:hypothetical protein
MPTYERREPTTRGSNLPLSSSNIKLLLNKQNFDKLLNEKLSRHGLNTKGNYNEILASVNNGLEIYLKNILERLIQINRARNVNLNLYSKYSERDPMFKIHTYNLKPIPGTHNLEPVPYSDFNIVFTKNMKSELNVLEHYEDLMAYKSKIEKISTYKTKIEELNNASAVGVANKNGTTSGTGGASAKQETTTAASVKGNAKPRTRRRTTTILKNYKNVVAKTQKKNEIDRQRKDTQYTLQTFLDNKPTNLFKTRVRVSCNIRIVFLGIGEAMK